MSWQLQLLAERRTARSRLPAAFALDSHSLLSSLPAASFAARAHIRRHATARRAPARHFPAARTCRRHHGAPRSGCCTQKWLKSVTKRSFRTTARSVQSVLPQCAAPRVGTSWSAPAVSRRVHCKRSHVHPTSHSGEHSALSQNS